MSAIGDYIHLTVQGYETHGIYHFESNESNYDEAAQVLNQAHKQMEDLVNHQPRQDTSGLEDAIQSLMSPGDVSGIQRQALDDLWNALENAFRDEFQKEVFLSIQRNTANVLSGKYSGLNVKNIDTSTGYTYLNNILQKVKSIEDQTQLIKNQMNKAELKSILKQINKLLEDIISEGNQALKSTGYNLQTAKAEALKQSASSGKQISGEKRDKIVTLINYIANQTAGTANLQKGTLFEDIIALAPVVAGQTSYTNITDYLQKHVVGTTGKTRVQFIPSNFTKEANWSKILGETHYKQINDNLWESTLDSQDKVDVEINWKGNPINISAKNVNLQSGYEVHILSGASLLSLLSMWDTDFANHYLNIVANHKGRKKIDSTLLNAAHDNIRPTILWQALAGYKPGVNQADTFIVNDNKTGQVRVFSIADLAAKAMKDIKNYTSITVGNVDIGSIHFANDKADTYSARISNLLADVHKQKVNVSLKPSLLTI